MLNTNIFSPYKNAFIIFLTFARENQGCSEKGKNNETNIETLPSLYNFPTIANQVTIIPFICRDFFTMDKINFCALTLHHTIPTFNDLSEEDF